MDLSLSLLANFQVTLNGTAVSHFRSDKERALLALLVLDSKRAYRRETLAGLFWGDQPQKLAFNNLRKTIHRLRQTLQDQVQPEPFLLVTAKDVQWNPTASVWVDVWEFTTLLEQSRRHPHRRPESCQICQEWLMTAVSLYHGNLLDGFALGDSPAFDEWVAIRREALRAQALSVLNHLIAYYELTGQAEQTAALARQLLALEPWQESAHRTLMRLLAAAGKRGAAVAQYETCRLLLATELDLEPERETTALYEAIKAGEPVTSQQSIRRSTQLPAAATPFIGRNEELHHLRQKLLHPDTRLLTLVGEGGVGKTRLALAAAAQVQHDFPHGTWFVDLATLAEGEEMPPEAEARLESRLVMAIAAALGLSLTGAQSPKVQLLTILKSWDCLLLLDNFETVLSGAILVSEILQATTGVVVLATSRELLQLQAEQVYRLGGLPLPPMNGGIEETIVTDSILLFQTIAARSATLVPMETLPTICAICRFLDGIPLGIELAASWMARLTPAEILLSLQSHSNMLVLPYRDVPERHRSMQVVFAGSWRLLNPNQQIALAQASVFRGGFTRLTAQQVITVDWADVVSLVDKSLLRLGEDGRYSLHELLRQFAAAQLTTLADTAHRHSHYYLSYLAQRATALWGREPQHALADLRSEFDNIHTAWHWAVAERQFDPLTQSLSGLVTYYARKGLFHEGIQVLRDTLAAVQAEAYENSRSLQGWLHVEVARLLAAASQFETAKANAEAGCQMAITLNDAAMQGWGQFRWARTLWMQAHFEASHTHLEEALAIAQSAALQRLEAECWLALSALADTHGGNYALAREHGRKALALFHHSGNRLGELRMLNLLGNFSWGVGDYALAQEYYEQSLQLGREVNSPSDEAAALANLGTVLREQGDYNHAPAYVEQGLRLFQEMRDLRREFVTLQNMSLLQHQMNRQELALAYGQQALAVARELETRAGESHPLCCLGHALLALNRPQAAAEAYTQSVKLHREAGNVHLAMEPLAGLIRVALAQDDVPQALAYAEEIVAHLAQGSLDGTGEPIRVQLTLFQALATAQDPRTYQVLAAAHQSLMARAAKIGDPARRQLFLENVPAHREVRAAWLSVKNSDALENRGVKHGLMRDT
jgi:DNA-binding SARP family transcriptional activator